ncbi:glutathione S-transferase family protein [Agarivorans sp. QJM3NY_33]|uniref:glutathione S-transferase family protein n=1 Tax=Agarivorans sp. QJM3NY_33 TaxID=3421432 RepID=UPI003D7D9DA1
MKIYGRTTSFNVQKVLWFLEELGNSYQHIELGGRFGGLDAAEFSKLNPMKKVPVLIDGDKVIWESHSILRYLAASYGYPQWHSQDPYQCSLYERWMDWSQVLFQPAFMGTFWGYYRMPVNQRNMVEVNHQLQKCEACLNILEQRLNESPYLAGSSLSLADICVGSILYRLTSQGLEITLPPKVTQWYQRLRCRRGYKKWIMSDFSELKAREAY